ncbi:TPM domain-containing protein [Archangium gephyra]|uniref:TPM domain-containing protein n=1 Tax=Archangium gephyra TaxID=48 RepID=UPI0035D42B8B
MMRWLWLLFCLVGLGSARAEAPRWEDIPLPSSDQALVDTTGTLKPDTFKEVNRLAAGFSGRGWGRLVVVVIPRSPEDPRSLANELYDSWRIAGEHDDGMVIVIALEDLSVGGTRGSALGSSWEDYQAAWDSAQQAMRAQEPNRAVRSAVRIFSEWEQVAPRPERETAPAPGPFAAFHPPHAGVADPDQMLPRELTRKARQAAQLSESTMTLVVYDRARHPVEARALAEHLYSAWNKTDWLVVASARPVDAWAIPPRDFDQRGGYRKGLPEVVTAWKEAMEPLGRDPSGEETAEAWDKAFEAMRWIARYPETPPAAAAPPEEKRRSEGSSGMGGCSLLLLPVALFLLAKYTLGRLEPGKGPHSIGAFIACGLAFTVAYGCALGWVLEQSALLGIFAAFFCFPWVFIAVRRFCGYFDFNPFYAIGSACPLAALGLFFCLVAFSAELFQVGPLVRTVEVNELPRAAGGAFHVRGAVLRKDHTSDQRLERPGGNSMRSAKLAPLVAEGWTPEQPVPAWLLCRHHDDYKEECAGWDAPIKDVVAPTSLGSLSMTRLIQEAEFDTHLRSAPGARVLSRSDDAGASVTRVLLRGLLLPLFFVGVFVAAAFIGRWWDENDGRQRPSQTSTPQSQQTKSRKKKA